MYINRQAHDSTKPTRLEKVVTYFVIINFFCSHYEGESLYIFSSYAVVSKAADFVLIEPVA